MAQIRIHFDAVCDTSPRIRNGFIMAVGGVAREVAGQSGSGGRLVGKRLPQRVSVSRSRHKTSPMSNNHTRQVDIDCLCCLQRRLPRMMLAIECYEFCDEPTLQLKPHAKITPELTLLQS